MLDPNVTLRPADKLTADEWRAERADRESKELVYEALAVRLAYLDTKHLCKSCDKPSYGDDALCPICRAWATAVEARLTDQVATRKLKVQLVAGDLLEFFHQMPAISEFYSHDYHVVSLRPFEDQLWESRA